MASFCFIFAAQRNQFVLLHLPEFPWTSQIPIDFPLISHWFPIDFPLISHWFPIDFPLISHWFPIDFPLISHHFSLFIPTFPRSPAPPLPCKPLWRPTCWHGYWWWPWGWQRCFTRSWNWRPGDWRIYGGDTLWLCQNSYWKWPFIVDFPIKNGDFP